MNPWGVGLGIASGVALGFLDVISLVALVRRILVTRPVRTDARVKWLMAFRLLMIFLVLLVGAALLGVKSFIGMAGAYLATRIILLSIAARHGSRRG